LAPRVEKFQKCPKRENRTKPDIPKKMLREGQEESKGAKFKKETYCPLDCRDDNLEEEGQCCESCTVYRQAARVNW